MAEPTEREQLALKYDPFQGEDVRRRLMRDRIVITRKVHHCVICWDRIAVGARSRATTELVSDGGRPWMATTYTCPICVEAEAESWSDAGEAICARASIGIDRANSGEPNPFAGEGV